MGTQRRGDRHPAAGQFPAPHQRVKRHDDRLVMFGWPLLPGLVQQPRRTASAPSDRRRLLACINDCHRPRCASFASRRSATRSPSQSTMSVQHCCRVEPYWIESARPARDPGVVSRRARVVQLTPQSQAIAATRVGRWCNRRQSTWGYPCSRGWHRVRKSIDPTPRRAT